MYLVGLGLVLASVVLDIRVLDAMDEMASHIRWALKLNALSQIFAMEEFMVDAEANFDREQAQAFQARARQYFEQAKLDQVNEGDAESQAHQFEQLAEDDQRKADELYDKIRQDDALRAELQTNLTRDQQIEDDIEDKLRTMDQGVCAYDFAGWLCDIIGGAVELKREADQETLKIQQDLVYLKQVKKQEYLDQLVADALQGNATSYNQTASELLQAAMYWDAKARSDAEFGAKFNATSMELENVTERLEERGKRYDHYREAQFYLCDKEIGLSVRAYHAALRRATAALIFALCALSFFIPRLGSKALHAAKSAYEAFGGTLDLEFGRRLYATLLHCFIFFIVAGTCGSLITRIEEYGWKERAAIVFWFSSVASVMQTLLMQSIPHVLAVWPMQRNEILPVIKHSMMRFISLTLLYGIEILVACTAFPALVSSDVIDFFGNPLIVMVFLSKCALYLYVFEPRDSSQDCNVSMTSTLPTVDDFSRSLSEVTPLTTHDDDPYSKVSLAGTGSTASALINMDLGPQGRQIGPSASQQTGSLDSCSPYFVHVRQELQTITIAFDVLMVSALVGVLQDCLPLVYKDDPGHILIPASFAAFVLAAGLIGLVIWTSWRRGPGLHKMPQLDERFIEIVRV